MKRDLGTFLKLRVSGASHAPEMTFRLENFPAGFRMDADALAAFMERRAPGRDRYSTARRETDVIEFRAGLDGGVTTGEPIVGAIANRDMRPGDYGAERTVPRPGHADFGQWIETGRIPTGGGANSGRLTAPLCAAGGLCKQLLAARGIAVEATLAEVGGVAGAKAMLAEIDRARKDGDSVGGRVHCRVTNVPAGLGGALWDGLESDLAAALFAIPGVKGVTWGRVPAEKRSFEGRAKRGDSRRPSVSPRQQSEDSSSCDAERLRVSKGGNGLCVPTRGSSFNDCFRVADGAVVTATNRAGGILGGRATGMPIEFDVWMKPTPTIFKPQDSVDLATMTNATCAMKGRHDPCIARRAVPVVEAVAAFVLTDALLADEAAHPRICLTLTGQTLEENLAQYRSQRYFTDMVELRVDLLAPKERARAAEFPALLWEASRPGPVVPIIFTYRRKSDGGAFVGSEKTRARFFMSLVSRVSCLTSSILYFDFEDDFSVPAIEKLAREKGVRIIRSRHEFMYKTGQTSFILKPGEIAKFAFLPKSLAQVANLFRAAAVRDVRSVGSVRSVGVGSVGNSRVLLAMGAQGLASRVLAARLGAPWTYASVGGLGELGHVSPQTLVRDYRFRSVTRAAALYGVTGWPLKATRSPELHNAMFAAAERDALMIPFPAETAREALDFMNAMGMKGMAVTIPHKVAIMPLLDKIDPVARRVGAVNTVVREGTKLVGYNTDVEGFSEAIVAFVGDAVSHRVAKGRDSSSADAERLRVPKGIRTAVVDAERLRVPKGLCVAVLGAGGASKAVVFALKRLGAKVEVFHRRPLTEGFDLIVNATPVDPIPDYRFTGRELVYDLVYVPAETPLLARARAAGCRVENGFSMLLAQARAQQRLFGSQRKTVHGVSRIQV